jgi:hypothetical protein
MCRPPCDVDAMSATPDRLLCSHALAAWVSGMIVI